MTAPDPVTSPTEDRAGEVAAWAALLEWHARRYAWSWDADGQPIIEGCGCPLTLAADRRGEAS